MDNNDKNTPKNSDFISEDEIDKGAKQRSKRESPQQKPLNKDWTTCLADEWEISENSMLTDEVVKSNLLTTQEMDKIIDKVVENTAEKEKKKKELDAQSASRKAAETLITSLSQSVSETKTPALKETADQQERSRESVLVPDETADFPASSNPFKHATNSGLLEIAKSLNTTEATLMWLSENPDAAIRMAVASNPRASKQILARLIKDHNGQVKLACLDNDELTSDLVVELLSDANPLVSLRAYEILNERRKKAGLEPIVNKAKLNTVNELPAMSTTDSKIKEAQEAPITASGAHEAIEFLRMMAQRHTTPIERLAELASHSDSVVRAAVARNSKSPIDVLWSLAHDQNTRVKKNLILNESCPIELLWALKDDPDRKVSSFAQQELDKFESK